MNLSPKEEEYLAQLKKNTISLRKFRWPLLILGSCLATGKIFYLTYVFYILENEPLAEKIYRSPDLYIGPLLGGLTIGMAIKGFKGSPLEELVIKVVEEQRAKDS